MLRAERQNAQMSKSSNDRLTRSGTGCFIAVYTYGNRGCQRVNIMYNSAHKLQQCHQAGHIFNHTIIGLKNVSSLFVNDRENSQSFYIILYLIIRGQVC